jgi:hypothetical protein
MPKGLKEDMQYRLVGITAWAYTLKSQRQEEL